MAKKMTRDRAAMEKLRLKARTKYLESGGSLSMVQISKEVGVSRQTVTKWKQVDDWEKDLAEVKQEVDAKVKKAAAANLYDDLAPEFREVSNLVQLTNKSAAMFFYKRNSTGDIMRDENGTPVFKDNVEPKDLRHISMIAANNHKTMLALTGQPTEHIKQETTHSGSVDHEHHEAPGVIDTCMEKMNNGELSHADGQGALQKLAEAFQKFRGEVVN